jgi:hypothetical protein
MSREVSAFKPMESAWRDMVSVLFTPFDFIRWLILGIPLFLINCGGSGANFNGNFNMGNPGGSGPSPFTEAVNWVDQNMALVVGIVLAFLLVMAVFIVIVAFLQSRGVFMLVDMLSTGVFSAGTSWGRTGTLANSYFLFLISIQAISMIFPLVYFVVILGWPFLRRVLLGEFVVGEIITIGIVMGLYILLLALPLTLLTFVVRNFSVPIMAATNKRVLAATREAFGLVAAAPGALVVFLLIRIVLAVAVWMLTFMTGILLCCLIVGCIPVVGQYAVAVVTAPIGVFLWCYSLRFVEQFDERYKVLPEVVGMPPVPPLPPFDGEMPTSSSTEFSSYQGGQSWPPATMPPPLPPDERSGP